MKTKISLFFVALLLIGMFILPFETRKGRSTTATSENSWWNRDWQHRIRVNLTENSGHDLIDFPVEVSFGHNGTVQTNGTDIRVVDNLEEIPSYVEECNSTHVTVIFETNLTASESKAVYVYYGNANASLPSYPLVPLVISEGATGSAVVDNRVYIGWDYTTWGWSNNVELWNDFKIDFNGNGNLNDESDLIRDYAGMGPTRQGGLGRFRKDLQAIGLGNYLGYVQNPVYVQIDFADSWLRVYKHQQWVETCQVDHLWMFSPTWDYASCEGENETNLIDGQGNLDGGFSFVFNSHENPGWMAFRDSSSGLVFVSAGSRIGQIYNFTLMGKEFNDFDRGMSFDFPQRDDYPLDPYDQPLDCRVYWYGDNSYNYVKVEEIATILNNQPIVKIVPDTVTVPDDYPTIQGAVDAASPGDIIYVYGPYYYEENVVVNKSVSLIGIFGPGLVSFTVVADNVYIKGFYFRSPLGFPYGRAIVLNGVSECEVSNVIVSNIDESSGIVLTDASNNIIADSQVWGLPWGGGIVFERSPNNTIFGNSIEANYGSSIYLADSSDNKFFHNQFCVYEARQVEVIGTSKNVWDDGYPSGGNYWSDCNGTDLLNGPYQNETGSDGIGDSSYVVDASNQDNYPLMHPYGSIQNLNTSLVYLTIQSAIDASETVNGHTIFVRDGTYYENVIVNKTVSLIGEDRNFTAIDGCEGDTTVRIESDNVCMSRFTIRNSLFGILSAANDVAIRDNYVINFVYQGIQVNGNHNRIGSNLITDCGCGILIYGKDHTIDQNVLVNCSFWGVQLSYGSTGNIVRGNIIENNPSATGLFVQDSDNNTISENWIIDNELGIGLSWSEGNINFHNNFINNTIQVYVDHSINSIWDNGCEGNFWSDYLGTDSNNDGIGDTPYVIDENNTDNYPLMNVYWNPCDINHDLKVDMKDIGRSARAYDTVPGDILWNPHADITGPQYLVPDNKVDMRDISQIAWYFGEDYL